MIALAAFGCNRLLGGPALLRTLVDEGRVDFTCALRLQAKLELLQHAYKLLAIDPWAAEILPRDRAFSVRVHTPCRDASMYPPLAR